jgi:hypothetical protein
MQRKLAAQAEREHLLAQWQAYPPTIQQRLAAILQHYGLQAAELATEALEACAGQKVLHESRQAYEEHHGD